MRGVCYYNYYQMTVPIYLTQIHYQELYWYFFNRPGGEFFCYDDGLDSDYIVQIWQKVLGPFSSQTQCLWVDDNSSRYSEICMIKFMLDVTLPCGTRRVECYRISVSIFLLQIRSNRWDQIQLKHSIFIVSHERTSCGRPWFIGVFMGV